jgi:hypothetical protein
MIAILSALVLASPPPTNAAPPTIGPPRSLAAARIAPGEEMTVDGRGDEPVWSRAAVGDRFMERTPELGGEPPVRTTFQVAYDSNGLYVLVRADTTGDPIVRTLQRDSFGVFADDSIALKIDAHHDRRSAVTLAVNADGTQVDTLTLEDGRVGIREWDAVWKAVAHRREGGFDVEFWVPFAILGVKGGKSITMGLDVTRDDPIRQATYDWRLIVPPRHPVSASSFGTLTGLEDITAQRALEFTPYVAASTDFTPVFRFDPRRRANLAAGGDARIQIGTGSYVEASVLTDFAQVEADQVQVARDRFPLFFPERRPFFINGLDVFNFGRQREGQLFFSRRIGLDAGLPVPIAGGVKAYGRTGPVSYGVLNVQTLRQLPHDDEFGEDEGTPPENFSVGRIRVQTGKLASVGLLVAGKQRFGTPEDGAFSGGVDGEIRALGGKLRTYAFAATTYLDRGEIAEELDEDGNVETEATPAEERADASGHLYVEYQGLYVRPRASWLWSGENFEAPLGFYRRPGTAKQDARIEFAPRPRAWGLREIVVGPRTSFTTNPDYSELLTHEHGGGIEFRFRNPWQFEYRLRWNSDQVQDDFDLYTHTVPAATYTGWRHEFELESPRRNAISGRLNYQRLQLFGGEAQQFRINGNVRLSKHFTVSADYTHLIGQLAGADQVFNFGFLNGTVLAAINPRWVWDNLVRLNLEPGSETLGLQSRLRWRYRPGSDVFLVYRNSLPLGPMPTDPEEIVDPFHSLTLKVTFYLRALLRR